MSNTFVPGHKHDLFISYAHVDDQPDVGIGIAEGWVTTLVHGLKRRLAQRLGRSDAFSLWMDQQLTGNDPITPEIFEAVRSSATLLIILSSGYVNSEWCLREKNSFLSTVKEWTRSSSRVFIVERDKLEEGERPQEFQDLVGYRFYVEDRLGRPPRTLADPQPDPSRDQRYYELLNDLSDDLEKEFRLLRDANKSSGETLPSGRPVFLAEVTDDLDSLRNEVKGYLEKAGLRVLPTPLPRDPAAFQQAVDRDLAECTCFVQLLSNTPGKKSPDLPQGYPRLQYDCAVRLKKPILQWRHESLDLNTVHDADHHALLTMDTVLSLDFEAFKAEAVRKAVPSHSEAHPQTGDSLIFVNVEGVDRPIGQQVGEWIYREGVGYALPLQVGNPGEIRKDLEKNLADCDGLIIIYGKVAAKWVRDQLQIWRKINRRKQPPRVLAVYEGPPPPKESLDYKLGGMLTIDGSRDINETPAKLQSFLHTVQSH